MFIHAAHSLARISGNKSGCFSRIRNRRTIALGEIASICSYLLTDPSPPPNVSWACCNVRLSLIRTSRMNAACLTNAGAQGLHPSRCSMDLAHYMQNQRHSNFSLVHQTMQINGQIQTILSIFLTASTSTPSVVFRRRLHGISGVGCAHASQNI